MEQFPFYISLIVVIVLLIMLANKIKVAYPVLLVLAGLAISITPGIPMIHIDPELIFIIFLPPLLYDAAWNISWRELWRWRRIISSFAFIVVFFTAFAVAIVANHFIPGCTIALGFLLGGIVSPPDAVSANAILKFVKVPKRMSSILEGESLLNDASSLIIFRFAMISVATGQFIWRDAALSFSWMLIGGVAIGLLVGWLIMKAQKYLPTDANTDIVLSIVTPYILYTAAEELHSSGVLAVVCGGLFLSRRRHQYLGSSSRLRGGNFWESLVFVLNGLVFILIGLSLPEITAGLGKVGLGSAIGMGALITAVLILCRMLSAYGAVVVTLIARNFIKVADARNPGYKVPFVLGWSGMRGVVSLAAALSIPVNLADGSPFPLRNLILFITFVAILLTLVLQGLTLPFLIKKVAIPDVDETLTEEEIDSKIKRYLAEQSLRHLKDNYGDQIDAHPILQRMVQKWESTNTADDEKFITEEFKIIYRDLLDKQRSLLLSKNIDEKPLQEEVIRKHLVRLDLEEEKLLY